MQVFNSSAYTVTKSQLCASKLPLETTVQSMGSFVTERFYSLRYESYSVFHVFEAKPARFQSHD